MKMYCELKNNPKYKYIYGFLKLRGQRKSFFTFFYFFFFFSSLPGFSSQVFPDHHRNKRQEFPIVPSLIFLFLFPEGSSVHADHPGHRYGGEPDVWPFQHRHSHHQGERRQRQSTGIHQQWCKSSSLLFTSILIFMKC